MVVSRSGSHPPFRLGNSDETTNGCSRYRFDRSWARFGRRDSEPDSRNQAGETRMKSLRSELLLACLISIPAISSAQTEPVIVEAESGALGANLTTGTLNGATYVTTTVNRTTAPSVPHIATYGI